jgi:SM-20-related protein
VRRCQRLTGQHPCAVPPRFSSECGRLRLLRSKNLEDAAVEVPPTWGTLLALRRSERSIHGHTLFAGERRVVQLNRVMDQKLIDREVLRHRRTARLKRLLPSIAGT